MNSFIYILILLVCSSFQALSQTNSVWVIGNKYGLGFEKGKVSAFNLPSTHITRIGSASVCTYQGKLDLYTNANSLFNNNHQPVLGWTGISFDSLFSVCFLKIDVNRIGILYLYKKPYDTLQRVFLSEYDKRINGGNGGIVPGRHKIPIGLISGSDINKASDLVKRLYDRKYILYLRHGDTLRLATYEFGKPIIFHDKLLVNEGFIIPKIPISDLSFYYSSTDYSQSISHSGNILLLKSEYALYKKDIFFHKDTLIQYQRRITSIRVDKTKLRFNSSKIIYSHSYEYKVDSLMDKMGSYFTNASFEFSPNDSFYYIGNQRCYGKKGRFNGSNGDSCVYQLNVNILNDIGTTPKFTGFTRNLVSNIFKLMPDGGVYFTEWYYDNLSKSKKYYLHSNKSPNTYGNASFSRNIYSFSVNESDILGTSASNRWYDYVKPIPKIDYKCDAVVSMDNHSDLSLKMNKFTWYFSRTPNGNYEDTIISFEPIVTYHKSGKYPYKVYGYSDEAVYGEWYEDTLYVNIPSKPVAKFLSTDSIICRFLPLQFKNYSQSFAVKPNFQKIYLWTFGDGATSSDVEPIHIYNQPGDYTVSLFISNGFCDSTLVKNQYIKVVDAPKPGFQVSNRQGCSPYTANIIDTVSLNVRKKEYFFSDSSIWKPILSQKFNYTFVKPGHYWAVQKLYGYTGCVIKTDSIQFYISKGILSTDSIPISLASYDTSNILHLQWLSHPSAVNYELLKSTNGINYSLLIQTTNNSYSDNSIPLNPTFYKVRAIDSCGNFSSSKNIAKPSFISGNRLNDNDAMVINYSLPLGFGLSNKNELQADYNNFSNLSNLQSNPSNPFVDIQFAKEGFLKKCYRLRSEFSGQEMHSNCFCSNFVPKVFIPNVFTPDENGLNELFSPLGLGIVSYSMKIYNRWGEMVFSDSKPWDGKHNNQLCMDGVYFYTISLLDNNQSYSIYKGTIQIIK